LCTIDIYVVHLLADRARLLFELELSAWRCDPAGSRLADPKAIGGITDGPKLGVVWWEVRQRSLEKRAQ
jgi:hypothetical protein